VRVAGGRGTRVVVADDAVLFREGLVRILEGAGMRVVAQAGDRGSLLAAVEAEDPDAIITDIRMPPTGTTEGLDAAIQIRATHADTAVMVLSQYIETRHVARLFDDGAGGVGYLLKDRVADGQEFIDSLERLVEGSSVIDPQVIAQLMRRGRQGEELDRLTGREREILAAMAEGRSNSAIGRDFFLSPKTVETHVGAIFSKLGLEPAADDHRRVLAVLAYLRAAS
jgi:DNA-binding NarL/FixJ family response regulator